MLRPFAVCTALVVVPPSSAAAQSTPPAPADSPSPSQPPAAIYRVRSEGDAFALESGDGDVRLQLGLLLHVDGRFAPGGTDEQGPRAFAVRRLRPFLRGRIGPHVEFYLNPDFAGGTLVVQDVYVDAIFGTAFRIRAGKTKTPFGFERLQPASNILFVERAFPTALAPNRDIGIQVLGNLAGGVVSYLTSVTNGVVDGGSADTETDDRKDISGRVIVRPFLKRAATHRLRGLGVAVAASRATTTGLPSFRTPILQQPYFSYASGATPAGADGARVRYSPQAWYYGGPFGGWFDYVQTDGPVRRGDVRTHIAHRAWQAAGSWVLTGEAATDSAAGVRPRNDFDFRRGHWGAFQIAARYHVLEIDPDAIALGLASPGASRKAEAWTVGLRWYISGHCWYTFNFERAVFDDNPNGPRPPEHAVALRTQLGF